MLIGVFKDYLMEKKSLFFWFFHKNGLKSSFFSQIDNFKNQILINNIYMNQNLILKTIVKPLS